MIAEEKVGANAHHASNMDCEGIPQVIKEDFVQEVSGLVVVLWIAVKEGEIKILRKRGIIGDG